MTLRRQMFAKWLPRLFFLALILLGFLTSADYGQPWDEPWEQDILRMNYNQYAMFFGSVECLPLLSSIDVPESGLIEDSLEKDHGTSAYYPVFFLVKSADIEAKTRMVLWHAYTWLWFVAGAFALYSLAKLFGLSTLQSMAATLFLVLMPRFFAQGHYNNKDIVLFSLVLILLYLTFTLLQKPTNIRCIVFALIGAIATNTKIIGLPIYGLCLLMVCIPMLRNSKTKHHTWRFIGISTMGFLVFFFLLTPAAWSNPLAYLGYTVQNAVRFSRWDHLVLFRGVVYHLAVTSLPRIYLPYMIVTTTPLWLLLLIAIGQGYALHDLVKRTQLSLPRPVSTMLLLLTALWVVPLAYVIIGQPILYNGWRHFYFLAAPLLALAVYGLKRFWDTLYKLNKPTLKYALVVFLAAAMALTAYGMLLSHPTQYTYYNPFLLSRDVTQYMELDYWNVSVLQTLLAFLNENDEATTVAGADYWSQVGLTSAYDLLSPAEQARLIVLPQEDPTAAYMLTNPTYRNFSKWQHGDRQPITQTNSYGFPICEIYMQNAEPEIID